jgi:hypothetical protein
MQKAHETNKVIESFEIKIRSTVGLDDGWVEFESQYGQEFSLLHIVQTRSGAHPASCPMGTGGSFPGCKAAGA